MVVECKGCISESDHAGVEPYSYIEIKETFCDKLCITRDYESWAYSYKQQINIFKISQVTPSFHEETTLIREIQTLNNGETI